MSSSCRLILVMVLAAGFLRSFGAEHSTNTTTNTAIQDLGGGRLQIGSVTVDSKAKGISFPAVVNMNAGVVEYLIVTTKGKVHESLLRTDVQPIQIHTAMLLLGVKQGTNSEVSAFFDGKRDIPGKRIKVEVKFLGAGRSAIEIETLLAFAESKRAVRPEEIPYWVYNGSRFSDTPNLEPVAAGAPPRPESAEDKKETERVFMAQREGSILSLIADPAALVNNPRKDRENDELWILHTPQIPPVGSAVEVTFTMQSEEEGR